MINEEGPSTITSDRIHIRDDAVKCGGFGIVRSLVAWDLTSLSGSVVTADASVTFEYTYNWGYLGNARPAAIHRVLSAWDDKTSWSNAPAIESIAWSSAMVPANPPAAVSFSIPAKVVQTWIDAPPANNGLVIKLVDESCPSPRMPVEFETSPTLLIPCQPAQ